MPIAWLVFWVIAAILGGVCLFRIYRRMADIWMVRRVFATYLRERKPIALIVAADEPALFFASIEDAEQYLEPIDVARGVYHAAYGPAGEVYNVTVVEDRVAIARDATRADDPAALQSLLRRYFTSRGEMPAETATLGELLARCFSDR